MQFRLTKKPRPLKLISLPGGPPAGTKLCDISDIPEHGGKEVVFKEGRFHVSVLIQRLNGVIKIYDNHCPHAGTPLNMFDEKFLNLDGTQLICRTHGALFEHSTGICTQGPCEGKHLREIDCKITETAIYTK